MRSDPPMPAIAASVWSVLPVVLSPRRKADGRVSCDKQRLHSAKYPGHSSAYPPWITSESNGPRPAVHREDAPMLSAEENDLLCRVEGDAPMGQIMRRHWLPACLSEEV